MTRSEREELLCLARESLETFLHTGRLKIRESSYEALKEKRGLFVTLERGVPGSDELSLRGCIGYLIADTALSTLVQRVVVDAATKDPRFSPVRLEELPQIRIEISVLGPFETLRDPNEILIGRHGLLIEKGGRRGLLLPQVASREGWDRETFLRMTYLKAGLLPEDWGLPDTRISLFSAEVFHEV